MCRHRRRFPDELIEVGVSDHIQLLNVSDSLEEELGEDSREDVFKPRWLVCVDHLPVGSDHLVENILLGVREVVDR